MFNSELLFKTDPRRTFLLYLLQAALEAFLLSFHRILWMSLLIHKAQCTKKLFFFFPQLFRQTMSFSRERTMYSYQLHPQILPMGHSEKYPSIWVPFLCFHTQFFLNDQQYTDNKKEWRIKSIPDIINRKRMESQAQAQVARQVLPRERLV